MLEDQVAYLLQRYLGNYVRGLNKEALKISVWKGDVELKNMQLKPEALNALKLPVKVKAGFLGSVKLKVPWSRLGQDPVLVYLDRIFLLAEPATQVEGCSEDAVQEAKKSRIQEMELKLWEKSQQLKSEMNTSWLGSLISTIIGNLKLSISNIHIRYEDSESNPGHPFAAGVMLDKLSAMTVDDTGKETFITGGALDLIQKSVELDRLAVYFDSDIIPWHINQAWEDLLPSEWFQVFKFGTKDGRPADNLSRKHSYILQPVTGKAKYSKLRQNETTDSKQPLQKAVVNLDDVTISLSKDGYKDIMKLADNFAAFNQRLKYAHFRPLVAVKVDAKSWWKYACRAVSDQMKKASGKMSWEQVLRYASLRKRYISLYASLLKSDPSQVTISGNKEIEELDRELDIDLILQWRMLAHKFVEKSAELDLNLRKKKAGKSWWPFGGTSESPKEGSEEFNFTEEDWNRLNKIIGYKESDDGKSMTSKADVLHTYLVVHMNHNASRLIGEAKEPVAELSCEDLSCSVKLYPETKVFDIKLGSYQLSSPKGLLAESATSYDSLVGAFYYKPFDDKVDWSMVAKASPCYMTYIKDSIDQIVKFFESDTAVSQTIALETAAAVQMTIDEVKRTAQQQMNRALKDHARFSLNLDIAAPKITIPTDFCPDNVHATKLLLDLGNLMISTQDDCELESTEGNMYLRFDLVLSDVSAFLFDGNYHWSQISLNNLAPSTSSGFFPIIDKCGVILQLQQIRLETPYYPSTRVAVRLPSLGFHFSPARYHRLMQVIKIFEGEDDDSSEFLRPWNQADLEGWLSLLTWKGVGIREAVWQRRYFCLVGPFLYVLESPDSRSYKQYVSLRGKQVYQVPPEFVGNADRVLAVCSPTRSNNKIVEDTNALILRCESEDLRKTWHSRLQGAIYYASDSAPISGLSETSSDNEDTESEHDNQGVTEIAIAERLFVTGVLDELKICFSYSYQSGQSLIKVLSSEEKHLFEFRAIGGKVELSIRDNDIFIGTILKSLEIEDLVCQRSQPCYLARSFIGTADAHSLFHDTVGEDVQRGEVIPSETDDKFYEAPETLTDAADYLLQSPVGTPAYAHQETKYNYSSLEPPKFSRITGLLPCDAPAGTTEVELSETLESFVKAQIVIYDQNSSRYNSVDKQVIVTLATLTFFCRRPTILAIMEFVNSINIEDGNLATSSDSSSTTLVKNDVSRDADDLNDTAVEEHAVKGLLGKGKSRIMFNLTLKMAQAQIFLMKENETKLACLSQESLLTDIKVFPSSFSIKAALGNLKISDDSLPNSHLYYWACDMRNPGGRSFVELEFMSFSEDDEDYEGYDFSLFGELSEVRIVYLNRFVQEVVGYFIGLVPSSPKSVVKVTDQVTNSEKWFSAGEIEGSPAVKFDLSLKKPIILMPRRTDSLDFLRLDIVHITVKNSFQWIGGGKSEMNAVHLETLTVQVEDINLNVGTGTEIGESTIQDVNGLSVIIRRSLRDLLHKFPSTEVIIKIEELKAAVSNKEYLIITECAVSNFSEDAHIPPALNQDSSMTSNDATGDIVPEATNGVNSRAMNLEASILLKVSVSVDLVELSLYTGVTRDASLATVQVSGAWLLYKSSSDGKGFLSATLQGFSVFDDREGVEKEFRLAIGKPENVGASHLNAFSHHQNQDSVNSSIVKENGFPVPTMLIVDVKFAQDSTFVSLCIQRPQLLVALDFLLAVVEFFVPTVSSMLSYEEHNMSHMLEAVIMDQSIYIQPCPEFSISPQKPLIVDNETFDHFIYDGHGGTLYLKDGQGFNLTEASSEALIYVGSGKKLQFKNVVIKGGQYLDSCVLLGANSSYSVSKEDNVYLEDFEESPSERSLRGNILDEPYQSNAVNNSTELIIELQAVGPELTFYNTSKDVGELLNLSNKLLLAQLDAFGRIVLKGSNTEMSADILGLTMESNGIRILEPFDTSLKYSNACGKTNIHLSVSDIFMNFTFSILRLFLAVEDDILAFLRMTSKKMTTVCSHFDKVGTIENSRADQTYAVWRPHAPPGFAVLGDYLTPLDKPPTKGVLAINTNSITVKKPISFRLIWPPLLSTGGAEIGSSNLSWETEEGGYCSIWFPEAPKGYVALGCVVTRGSKPPPLSSAFCIPSSLVSPCPLRDCIAISTTDMFSSSVAFWRVDNSVGTFLPADPVTLDLIGKAYELRWVKYDFLKPSLAASSSMDSRASSGRHQTSQLEQSSEGTSNRRFEPVASFQLIWWNQGSHSRKRVSIWRPIVPTGMVYFGDIAVRGFEPPNNCIVFHESSDENIYRNPIDFQLVGQVKKQRGMETISFWLPQAPPGFVSLGCVACKGKPKQNELSTLRCMRSDLVTGDTFLEESVWDTSDVRHGREPFSIWAVGNELGTFIVRSGFKRPPRRFALKLADSSVPSGSDVTVIDAEIGTFSTALFDDYGGLMVPLFNISLTGITFSLHGRTEYLNCTVSFSLASRSYNDKYEAWEPLVEPVDGFLRYQYDINAPGAASQLRLTSTRDLNLNVSVSNANMIIQAYASWNNLSHAHESYKNRDAFSPTSVGSSIIDTLHRRNYYIIPQNKLGQDIFIRATEARGLQNIVRMPSGDMKAVKVPVSKNMLDSHLNGQLCRKIRTMVTIIITEAQFSRVEVSDSRQYTVAVRLSPNQSLPPDALVHQQSARTCGRRAHHLLDSNLEFVKWNEIFFFKVDSLDYYSLELIVTDMSKGVPVGFFSASLNEIAKTIEDFSYVHNFANKMHWIDLSVDNSMKFQDNHYEKSARKLQCAILVHNSDVEHTNQPSNYDGHKSGFIQISPSKEGPWTTVRLNYAAPAACWRLGNDVVASEVSVKDGNRYVNIRSLVSVRNNTNFILELCLAPKSSTEKVNLLKDANNSEPILAEKNRVQTDEFYETEKLTPDVGWVSCSGSPGQHMSEVGKSQQVFTGNDLPQGWEWIDDWHLDTKTTNTSDGWIYAPDVEKLRWPESFDPNDSHNAARQRRWLRSRKPIADYCVQEISVGLLQPGETLPLPLSGLTQSVQYFLKLRPFTSTNPSEYNWSSVVNKPGQPQDAGQQGQCARLCVSALSESEELVCCSEMHGTSDGSHKLWFCVSIQATEIAKDMHSDAIQDWCLVVKSPLLISNFLPLAAEYSVLEMQPSGHFLPCSRGVFFSGKTVHIYTADIRNPLFLSLLPQRGWLPIHEAVLISHPHGIPSKTVSLRSSISGRVIQIILEQNYEIEHPVLAKTIRVYAPYWLGVARCPPLTFRILVMSGKRHMGKIASQFEINKKNASILEEITEEEIYDGYTIASALNFNVLAISVAIACTGNEHFGPVKDLSPLGDMDGSLDVYAYDADGNCLRLFVSTKPCPYQSVPTKVISVRPFMTFTNRLGRDIYIKLSTEDEPKVLHASDSRVSFVCRGNGPEKLQVKLEDTDWSFPLQISREDTLALVLRTHGGTLKFLRTEIRGYEEGSRFVVVFRLGSTDGPIRIENRTTDKPLSIRQSGFGEDAWIHLQPHSTINFSWEDPYGDLFLDAKLSYDDSSPLWKVDFGRTGLSSAELGLQFDVIDGGDIITARFRDDSILKPSSHEDIRGPIAGGKRGVSGVQADMQNSAVPFEILIELGVVGISMIDHRPKELSYLYLERVVLSYSTGYDGGRTSRFKLIFGYLQLDNQLPLTLMPVLLAPEQSSDVQHPVFKMTITMQNENKDGIQVYPYVYIRVTEKCWRLDIHEPIIWAIVDFYNNLQLDRLPKSSTVTEVDPEIRFDLIDVSEVRLKLSLETAPGQRPHGVLGIWSPILSAVGNAFKIQVHLRRVMHRDRFMRKSSIVPAIGNRVWRDLIHNPLHLIFSVDVLGMTSSTLASLSRGFAELSTDGQFLQLRAKQVRSRRITGVGDGILQGTEALAQGVAFGVSGVVRKPVESARQNGLIGLAHGLGRAFLGFIVQPVSGALDFFSLTVDGIGASCSKCLEVFNNKTTFHRIRNPRAIRANGVLTEYCEKEAIGQMVLYLGEASRHFGCTEIFKEPSKFALSDYYEEHFIVPHQRIVLVTNKRVILLQCLAPDKMDKRPCKIMWDVPWDELMALELAKAGSSQPSHLILHLRHFRRSEKFARVIKCNSVEEFEGIEPQAVKICSVVRRTWKAYQADMKSLVLKVPSSQRHVHFAWSEVDNREPRTSNKGIISSRDISSHNATSDDRRFVKHSITFTKIWSSEQEYKARCSLCRKQASEDGGICSIWRPLCPDGYTYIGDIARGGIHPPNVAAIYRKVDGLFALPMGYDLVWRNCPEDYVSPVSIWHPRAPDGFVSPGCVAIAAYMEPEPDLVYCVAESLVEETEFEEQKVWSAPESYPWGCHIYQAQSDALHFVALRQIKEESNWKPMRVRDDPHYPSQSS